MVRHVYDLLFSALFFGNVLVGSDPSAVCGRMVHNRNDAPIAQGRYFTKDSSVADRGCNIRYILLDAIGAETAGCALCSTISRSVPPGLTMSGDRPYISM